MTLMAIFWYARFTIERSQVNKLEQAAVTTFVKSVGGAVGRKTTEKKIESQLRSQKNKDFVSGVKKAGPSMVVDSSVEATIKIEDTAKGKQKEDFLVCDEHDRFCFEVLANGNQILHRKQLFRLEMVFIRDSFNKYRVTHGELFEYNPETLEHIPSNNVAMALDFKFKEVIEPFPSAIHPRLIGGIDHRAAVGLGAELLNFEATQKPVLQDVTLGVQGYWSRKDKGNDDEWRLGVMPAYRFPKTNITVGPYFGINKGRNFVIGAAANVQLSR